VSGGGFFTDHEPDVLLTEIHRQARENPIIAMADTVRMGGRLEYGSVWR
jgi:exodeoxyribonuclease-5